MFLDKSCRATSAHKPFLKNRTVKPVVVSAKRFNDILYRSKVDTEHDNLTQKEEEKRYLQYLKDGNEALLKRFTNNKVESLEEKEEIEQMKLKQKLKEAENIDKQLKLKDEQIRKERIIKANKILKDLKAGQRSLHQALVESETMYQRKYNDTLNREITEEAQRQQRFEEMQCPETLIPTSMLTDEELKVQKQAKAITFRANFLKDLEDKRQRKLVKREEEMFEDAIQRELNKRLYEEEQMGVKKLTEKKRDFCRRAYRDSLKEKAEIAKYENICEQIDDRVICVDVTRRLNLDRGYNNEYKAIQEKLIRDREAQAVKICQQQQAEKRKKEKLHNEAVDRYKDEVEMDEARRQCQIEKLSKQRRSYQLEEQIQAKEKSKREAEIRRFKIAERLKNQESGKRFDINQNRRKDQAAAVLRNTLLSQRKEFVEKRQTEQLRMSECQVNNNIKEDLDFTNDAVRLVTKARQKGRSIYPIAKAVETYKRQNLLKVDKTQVVQRSKLRDYCWPGYHSKADLAYRQYERRDECRKNQEIDRKQILANCIKITKMAAEELPYKSCIPSCPT